MLQNEPITLKKIGAFLVIRKIMEKYMLPDILSKYLGVKDCGLFLDLAAYTIITENNAAQYYRKPSIMRTMNQETLHFSRA